MDVVDFIDKNTCERHQQAWRPSWYTVYIPDEPTTGFASCPHRAALESLNRLADAEHTVIFIGHHPNVIRTSDHLISPGPEGGLAGGEVVVAGIPEEIAACKASQTGRFLNVQPGTQAVLIFREPPFTPDIF
jgi:excinuclease ABC subunit A